MITIVDSMGTCEDISMPLGLSCNMNTQPIVQSVRIRQVNVYCVRYMNNNFPRWGIVQVVFLLEIFRRITSPGMFQRGLIRLGEEGLWLVCV